MVKDTTYYNCLQVPPNATLEQIRHQYYQLAMQYHPDRLPSSMSSTIRQEHELKFKEINEAYQVLSNSDARKRYDEMGKSGALGPEDVVIDPREMFKMVFGGDAFVDIIGEISFAQLLIDALREQEETANAIEHTRVGRQDERTIRQDFFNNQRRLEMERARAQRVVILSAKLLDKLALYTEGLYTHSEYSEYCTKQAQGLYRESFGPDLLHSVGYVYATKAKQYLGKSSFLGISSLYHSAREKGHIVSQVYSALTTARSVMTDIHKKQALQEQSPAIHLTNNPTGSKNTSEPMADFEEINIEDFDESKLRNMIWRFASLEVESVLREVCSAVLCNADKPVLKKRAEALKILGDAYRKCMG